MNKNIKTVEDYEKEYDKLVESGNMSVNDMESEVEKLVMDWPKEEAVKAILGLIYATKYEW